MFNLRFIRLVLSLVLGMALLPPHAPFAGLVTSQAAHAQPATQPATESATPTTPTDPRDLIPDYANRNQSVNGIGLPGASIRFDTNNPVALPFGEPTEIAFKLRGPAPAGTNLLLTATSDTTTTLVADFTHRLDGPDWVVNPQRVATLPVGVVELQAIVRVGEETVQVLKQPFLVLPPPAPVLTPQQEVLRDQLAEVQALLQNQQYIQGAGVPGFSIAFDEDFPLYYVLGSGEAVVPVVEGELPPSADVLTVAWSNELSQIIGDYTHLPPAPRYQIEPTRMDNLPPGITMLQLLVRNNGEVVQRVQQPVLIVLTEPDSSLMPEPLPAVEPAPEPIFAGPQPSTSPQPRLGEGWLDLSPSRDSLIIYVSSSTGNDANDGRSPQTAVKTPARGYSLIRSQRPDWLLFKRGDIFTDRMPGFYKSGRSATEPLVVGAYGDGPRPVFQSSHSVIGNHANSPGARPLEYITFRDLHFYANTRDPLNPDFDWDIAKKNIHGIRWVHPAKNITFENLLIEHFQQGMSLIPMDPGNTRTIAGWDFNVRRCVIRYNYGTWKDGHRGKSQGLYSDRVDGLRIEGSIFDHNGWDPRVEGAYKNKFNHNIYISSTNARVVIAGNIITRAGSNGIQLRPGGVIDGNFFAYNPIAAFAAENDSRISSNVVLHGNDFRSDDPYYQRGFGLTLFNLDRGVMENNIVAYRDSSRTSAGLKVESDVNDATVRNNIVYWWHDSRGRGLTVGAKRSVESNNITDNYARFEDPERTLDHWADELGFRDGPAWLDSLRSQQKGDWQEERTAGAVIEWVAEGFELDD
ncbi:MAG: right-handed parallel beta-helix repeat-containing protein [Planctomycetota bacterium]